VKRIKRIAVHVVRHARNRRVCSILVGCRDFSFPFHDLVEFSDGLQDILAETERLVPTNAQRPTDRTHMELESLQVQDAVEYNRNLYSGREVRERRAEGQNIAGGDWYMEISINGSDTDLSFNTVSELFTLVQEVIKRELTLAGKLISTTPAVLVAHG
jgi:hypothetical protein